jgi:uncharacterized membrane protein
VNAAVAPVARWPRFAVAGLVVAYAATFIPLSVVRHRGFFTARYDLGNMTQAVWSVAHGELFRVTDPDGLRVSRLGAHVDPILAVFAPLWRIWPSPEMLLVVQALVVATMAIPAYLLARHWLADERLAVAFAAVALLLPAVQWATLFDFHPVTLAAPVLLWAIWAAVAEHNIALGLFAVLAAMTKEQVGLALVILGIWMFVSLGRRSAGAILAVASLAWSAIAVGIIIPHYSSAGANALLVDRYGDLGTGVGGVAKTLLTRPWDAVAVAVSPDRGVYLAALLLPLLALSFGAPLLAAGALPDIVLNLLSSRPEQHHIEYHYSAVIAPFLLAAAIRGLATLRTRTRPAWLHRQLAHPGRVTVVLVGAAVVAGYLSGPLPFWQHVPGGSHVRSEQFAVPARAAVLRDAVALIPDDAGVSAGNRIAGHLSDRRAIVAFPAIGDAAFVVIDLQRPDVGDEVDPATHAAAVERLRLRGDFTTVFSRDGVLVFRRVTGATP